MTTTAAIKTLVTNYRQAGGAIRTIEARGGQTAATTNALGRHQRTRTEAMAALIRSGADRALTGALQEEDVVLANIAARKANQAGYVELANRLHAARALIRTYL